jgi:hypothetical protein
MRPAPVLTRHPSMGLAVGIVMLLAACGEPAVDPDQPTTTPTPTPTATEPTETPTVAPTVTPTGTPTEEGTPPEAGRTTSTAYFVRADDSGIWVEPVTEQLAAPTLGVARAAMDQLVAGPTGDPALETEVPPGTQVLDVNITDRVLRVDLSGEVTAASGSSSQETAFSQQLAHTGAQFDTVDAVQLLVQGEPITELWGHLDWSQPVEPDLFALSPITFDSHRWGEQVTAGSVTVGGEANTFEATLELRLLGPDGQVREDTFATATSGSGERGTWTHTFRLDEPGRWTVVAVEPDPSGGEGRPPFTTELVLDVT